MTLYDSILSSPERAGNEPFLLAPGRPALTYFQLLEQLELVAGQLAASGLKSGDRIAVMMDNGPELATALLSVMLFSTMVPLNPAFSEAELSYYLENLRVRAVLCDCSSMRVLRTICNRMQILCLGMVVEDGSPAGIFRLQGDGGDLGLSSSELQRPASEAIAAIFLTSGYKIPRRIFFVEFLPKGPTGKLLRSTLASLTERDECVPYEAPRTETEKWLAEIWCGLLEVDRVSVREDFFLLGGDSLLAERLMVEVSAHCQKVFPGTILLEVGTIASLAARIDQAAVTGDIVVPLQPLGSRVPLFCFHAIDGDVGSYGKLVGNIGRDQPIYGVRFFAGMGKAAGKETLCELIETYAVALKNKQPLGPYRLVGYSFGGILAFETARRLVKDGNEVEFIALIDTDMSEYLLKGRHNFRYVLKYWAARLMRKWPMFWRMSWSEKRKYVFQKIRVEREARKKARDHRRDQNGARIELGRLASLYSPAIYNGEVRLFHVMDEKDRFLLDRDGALGWTPWVKGGVKVIYVPGDHTTVMQDPNIATLAKKLMAEIEALDCTGSA